MVCTSLLSVLRQVVSSHDNFTEEDLESEEFFALQDDYEEVENPDKEVRKLANQAVNKFITSFPFWSKIRLYYSDDIGEDLLGKMRSETESNPIIILSPANLVDASARYNAPLEDAVATTIFHELGHAIVQLGDIEYDFGFDDEEEFVEDFADAFYTDRPFPAFEKFKTFWLK